MPVQRKAWQVNETDKKLRGQLVTVTHLGKAGIGIGVEVSETAWVSEPLTRLKLS